MSGWSGLDYLLLAIVAVSVAVSFFKGFARELISLGAAIGGIVGACWFYRTLTPWFLPYAKTQEIASLAAFLSILVAAVVAGAALSSMAVYLVKKSGLLWFDRLLGASFGLVRGMLVALAIVLGLLVFPPETGVLDHSRLAPYLVYGARVVAATAPFEVRARFGAGVDRARKIWNQRVIP